MVLRQLCLRRSLIVVVVVLVELSHSSCALQFLFFHCYYYYFILFSRGGGGGGGTYSRLGAYYLFLPLGLALIRGWALNRINTVHSLTVFKQ